MTQQAYPLAWPAGWPRTKVPQQSRFDVTFDRARKELEAEIARMGGRYVVLSTSLPLRRDGKPYAGVKPDDGDEGVAVYFERKGKQMVFACDRWDRVEDNVRAITKTIDAMRGIERWGASDMMERAFSAFQALPSPAKRDCWAVLGIAPKSSPDEVTRAYREKAKELHPDAGGSDAMMAELNAARAAALNGAAA